MTWTTPGAGGAGGGGSGTSGGGEIVPLVVESHTAGDTLTAAEDGSVHNNTGATIDPGLRALTLPAAAAGLRFTFLDSAGTGLTITAAAGDVIRVDVGRTATASSITSTAIGDAVELIAIDGITWVGRGQVGVWLINSQGITQSLEVTSPGAVDFGTAPTGMDFEYDDPFSVEFWYCQKNTGNQYLVGKALDGGTQRGWFVQSLEGTDRIDVYLISTVGGGLYIWKSFQLAEGEILSGRFKHVLLTYDGGNLAAGVKLYVNGAEMTNVIIGRDTLGANTIKDVAANLAWGRRDLGGLNYTGLGVNLAIYSVELTADNVVERFADGTLSDPNLASFSGLVGSWQMSNNDDILSVSDRTGLVNGTLSGSVAYIAAIPPDGRYT